MRNIALLFFLPLFLFLFSSFTIAPLTIWGLDQCVIYSLTYKTLSTLIIPAHGTVSSLGTLFPPGMIWFALPFVAFFKNIVHLSIALMATHAIILLICFFVILRRLDKTYLLNKFAYLAATLYLIFDISLLLTSGNLWEQYVVRTLLILLATFVFLSIVSGRRIYCMFSGYFMLFVPAIHPLQAIFIPIIFIFFSLLAVLRKIHLSQYIWFLIGTAICFLQAWLIWIFNDNSLINSLRNFGDYSWLGTITPYLRCVPLALQEWGKILLSPTAGTVLHLQDLPIPAIGSPFNFLTAKYIAFLRTFFVILTSSWALFGVIRYCVFCGNSSKLHKLDNSPRGAFALVFIYGICLVSFLILILVGIMPYAQRPDYGGQFLGLCNFATAIGIYYLLRRDPESRVVSLRRPLVLGALIATIIMAVILIFEINRDVRKPDYFFFALIPADEKMSIVNTIVRNSKKESKTKTYAYSLQLDPGLPTQTQPKWLTLSERFYTPHMLFDILFKRLGGRLSYVEIVKNPNYVISGPPKIFPEQLKRKEYNKIYQGSYLTVWKYSSPQ